jgi:hypothetical protein
MTAYYYKGSPMLAPLTIESNQPVYVSDTVSLKQIRTAMNAQRWEVTFDVATNDNAVELLLASCDGQANTDTIIMPQLKEVDDAYTADGDYLLNNGPLLFSDGVHAAGSDTITIHRLEGVGFVPKGSFIKFANHTKVYLLKTAINLSTMTLSDTVDIEIYPSLRVSVPDSSQIKLGDEVVLSYFPSIDNAKGITYRDGILASPGTTTLIEAL